MNKRGVKILDNILVVGVSIITVSLIYLFLNSTYYQQQVLNQTNLTETDISFRINAASINNNILTINIQNIGDKIDSFTIKVYSINGIQNFKTDMPINPSESKIISILLQYISNISKIEVIPGILVENNIHYLDENLQEYSFTTPPSQYSNITSRVLSCSAHSECDDNNFNTIDLCENFICLHRRTQCNDNRDNDNDTLFDLQDPDCRNPRDDSESSVDLQCNNGLDDDSDSLIDLQDPGCINIQDNDKSDVCIPTAEICDNKDNDCDEIIDEGCGSCSDRIKNQNEICIDVGGVCGRLESKELSCEDNLDNDCDNLIDNLDPGCPSARAIIWYHTRRENQSNIARIANTRFVTHIIVSNQDFNTEPEATQSSLSKLNEIKRNGLIPIWSRELWFKDGNRSQQDFAQPFIANYTDGTIVFSSDYYAWFLERLWNEAERYGIELVSMDTEPYDPNYYLTDLKNKMSNRSVEWFNNVRNAAEVALRQERVRSASYIFPSDSYALNNNIHKALNILGKNKIIEHTYFDCNQRLDRSLQQDVHIIGIWITADNSCYRESTSCNLTNYGKICSVQIYRSLPVINIAIWGPHTIFNNANYWYNANRGLFMWAREGTDKNNFIDAFISYCLINNSTCAPYLKP